MYKLKKNTIQIISSGEEFPLVDGNPYYEKYKDWLKVEGNIPEPEFTADELATQELEKAKALKSKMRAEAMLEGAEYQGYQISFTKDDGDAVVQVKNAFDMGLTSTTIHFENGTNFPIDATNFNAFALWFVTQRNTFFTDSEQ